MTIICQRCSEEVVGYEHRTKLIFQNGERITAGESAVLSCGCEVGFYDLDIDFDNPQYPARMIDSVTREVVLEWNDAGPLTQQWYVNEEADWPSE
jgi:hypothetical protein